jgi:tripartite-type tricarboxylate transporter receptor subunit TctC
MNLLTPAKTLAYALLACTFSGAAMQAAAQAYPSKPVRILIGTPAGGPGDVAARGAAQALSQAFGQSYIVENRVGADGLIAGEAAVRSAPDGYTLYVADSFAISLNPVIRAKMPYDPEKDLAPIIQFGTLASLILAHPSVPANTLREVLELAKAKPGSITFGTFGLASSAHLYVEYLKNDRNIVFLNVPYKAASLAFPALLAGEVNVVLFAIGPASAQVKAGKAKALAINAPGRSPLLPDVQTMKEQGVDINIQTWFALFAPAGTPRDIINRSNTEVAKGLVNNPEAKAKFLTSQGMETSAPAGASAEVFAKFLKADRENYAEVVRVTKVRIE